ncbi:hypothetical protein I4U23_017116 [Adineta vaga]|nr:hypothetical protein I4U23_017116 [Adineta vaga]
MDSIFTSDSEQNITRETLQNDFNKIVNELNVLKNNKHDNNYIEYINSIVINLLNLNEKESIQLIIFNHSLIFILRDTTIELLKKNNNNNNNISINLITLFAKFYSIKANRNPSQLRDLFFYQPLFDALVYYRINEKHCDVISHILLDTICKEGDRYSFSLLSLRMSKKLPLHKVTAYLCSSAYIDILNHLFRKIQSTNLTIKLDDIENFYLIECPNSVCFLKDHNDYLKISIIILEKMYQVYLNLLIEFTKLMENNYSEILIKPIISVILLLQSITIVHAIRQTYININYQLIDVLKIIIHKLNCNREEKYQDLLGYTIEQMFYLTFESELLLYIKTIDIIPILLEILDNNEFERIQFQSYRLLSIIMSNNEIQERLTNAAKIVKFLFENFFRSSMHMFSKFRPEYFLSCLKNLISNDEIIIEIIKQKYLTFLVDLIMNRNSQDISVVECECQRFLEYLVNRFPFKNFISEGDINMQTNKKTTLIPLIDQIMDSRSKMISMMQCQRQYVLEILVKMTSNKKVCGILQQNYLFLYYVKKQLLTSSEINLQRTAQELLQKLDTLQDEKKEDIAPIVSHNAQNDINYYVLLSYSSVDQNICYLIKNQLMKDGFQVRLGLDRRHESKNKAEENTMNSNIVLLCLSDSYVQNIHYQNELQYIFEQQCYIIPFFFKYSSQSIDWYQTNLIYNLHIDFSKCDFEYAYEQLKTEIIQLKRNLNRSIVQFQRQNMEVMQTLTTSPVYQQLLPKTRVVPVCIQKFLSTRCPLHTWRYGNLKKNNNIENEETFILIWFDPNFENIDEKLRKDIHLDDFVCHYIDIEQCVNDINSIEDNIIVLVVEIEVAEKLLSRITKQRCIDSVLIYFMNDKNVHFEQDKYSTIVGIYDNLYSTTVILDSVVKKIDKYFQMHRDFNKSESKFDVIYEFGEFLWLQMFIQAAQISDRSDDKRNTFYKKYDLISFARTYYRCNKSMLEKIDNFKQNYRSDDAISWYTALDFPSQLLNKALRTGNYDLIKPFLSFIMDLRNCLAREHEHLIEEGTIIVYRGMNVPIEEVEKFQNVNGEFISINGFLSTSRSRTVAEIFSGLTNDIVGNAAIIFQIECDAFILGKNFIFADISRHSHISDELEVLIDIGSIFRVTNIKQDTDGRWVIHMIGTSEINIMVKKYIEYYCFDLMKMKYNMGEMHVIISLLADRYLYEKAQEHLKQLLEQPNGKEIAEIYATMTRTQNIEKNYHILIRDHYNYTRDHLSKENFKQSALILNKIGFFLPRNNELRNSPEILKILHVNEDIYCEPNEAKSLVSILPQLGDNYRQQESRIRRLKGLSNSLKDRHKRREHCLKVKQDCIDTGDYTGAQDFHKLAFGDLENNCTGSEPTSDIIQTSSTKLESE